VNFCIGGQKINDVILRNDTLYYIFENRHELLLLCYCCEEPLACPDLQAEKRQMRGRKLQAMTWDVEELEDGSHVLVPFQRTNGYNGRDSNSCFHVCGYANEDIDRYVGGGQNSWDRQNS